ncbi:hypothetical protein MMC28_006952 [Mycoblastus sanguinarius]|nr:hypothetical protein [Mycoblastus sanguinarius]
MVLRNVRAISICIPLLALTLILWHLRETHHSFRIAAGTDSPSPPAPPVDIGKHYPSRPPACESRLDWLSELDIPFPVKYARRDIVVRSNSQAHRASVTKIDEPLFGDLQTVDPAKDNETVLTNCIEPLMLDVPAFAQAPPNASHILFGAATTLDRLEASLPFFRRWLAYTDARLFVVISGPDDSAPDRKRMAEMQSRMRDLGLSVTLVEPLDIKEEFTERYFSLVKILYANRDENTRWLGFIDDDTFVTSMSALVSALDKHDSTRQLYLGALSEEWWTVVHYGLIGMGGGGIFLSVPLAKVINANHKECKENSQRTFGDHKIFECIERHTKTRLTTLPGLYQIDIHGDRSGVFESGRQILTLHHWKEGYWDEKGEGPDGIRHPRWFPMDEMSLVTDVCDRCYLQRWQFGTDTILSNGYSISTYPTGELLKPQNQSRFDKMEETWVTPVVVEGSNNTGWDHYLGPLRPKLKLEEEKIPYRFLAGFAVDGGVRQYYRHLGGEDLDTVIELFWIREEAFNS